MNTAYTTPGVLSFLEENKCYWFLGVINSYQTPKFQAANEFQVWKFLKNKTGNGCKVVCEDGDDNKILIQRIPFTDCEQTEFTFWLQNNTVYLPEEH